MDNYLSDRWPAVSEGRSLPMPPAPRKSRRDTLQVVFLIVGILLLIAALLLIVFFTFRIVYIVRQVSAVSRPGPENTARPTYSAQPETQWTPEDLPWSSPAPEIQLALDGRIGAALPANTIYKRVLPGVVSVSATQKYGYSTGTGILVESSGYVLTNYHIINGGLSLEVMLLDGEVTYDARLVGYDREFDLAVLKIDGHGLPTIPLGDSDSLSVGDRVYAIGNPMGNLLGSMTEGIVSALGRDNSTNGLTLIQTSAPVNSGNSGGPLLNDRGQVVGIVSAKITGIENNTVIEGLGLAIPTTDLLPFVNRILATGASWRPSIGISCIVATVDGRTGIRIEELTADAPRDAGLRPGDLIVAANGTETPTLAALRRVLYTAGVDSTITCTVLRDGQQLEFTFALIDTLEQ